MESLVRYLSPPHACGYLPEQTAQLEYEYVAAMRPDEYQVRLEQGWRHFGGMLFHPQCPTCSRCEPLRVLAKEFQPNRSQHRCRQRNEGDVRLRIGPPSVTREKLDLYDRFHNFRSVTRGWAENEPKDAREYAASFVENPFPVQEWCYYVAERLVGVGYVDELPVGLSAIYFVYDPELRGRALGTWNVLCTIARAAQLRLPHVYLGYYVAGCASLEYKANFHPHERRGPDGRWRRKE